MMSITCCSWGLVKRPMRVSEFAWISSEVSRSGARILLHPPVGGLEAWYFPFSCALRRRDMYELEDYQVDKEKQ